MGQSYLLDSHIPIWIDSGNPRITPAILETLRSADRLYLSAVTSWELGLKQAVGKLQLRVTVSSMLQRFGLLELPIAMKHADRATALPLHHRDPFDRMLIAQAIEEGLILVSGDRRLARYAAPLLQV